MMLAHHRRQTPVPAPMQIAKSAVTVGMTPAFRISRDDLQLALGEVPLVF
jgi:hypothetical protein